MLPARGESDLVGPRTFYYRCGTVTDLHSVPITKSKLKQDNVYYF